MKKNIAQTTQQNSLNRLCNRCGNGEPTIHSSNAYWCSDCYLEYLTNEYKKQYMENKSF